MASLCLLRAGCGSRVEGADIVAQAGENDAPGLREYHRAMATWAPQLPADGASVLTWSGAKLLEAAPAEVDDRVRGGTVTAALILEGLGKIGTRPSAGWLVA